MASEHWCWWHSVPCGLFNAGSQFFTSCWLEATTVFSWLLVRKERKGSCSVVSDSVTPWTVAYQAPPSMGFSRQEYWSGLPFPSPGDLPDPGIEPGSPAFQADALTSEPPGQRILVRGSL